MSLPHSNRARLSHSGSEMEDEKSVDKLSFRKNNADHKNYERAFRIRTSINGKERSPHQRNMEFNKYYINPERRYKAHMKNPKGSQEKYEDETYVYNNLHNYQFWNWVHPLDQFQLKPIPSNISQKVNVQVLEGFKNYIENSPDKRLPLAIRSILNRKI